MATSKAHYAHVLADVYAWMLGGFDAALARNAELFAGLGLAPRGSGTAVDLGAGCGFQSIPLADLGFAVTAIDLDAKLLDELEAHAGQRAIRRVQDDFTRFRGHVDSGLELAVCMTDTLLHLESKQLVTGLLVDVAAALEPGGQLILTFRDLTHELHELDRFIPVRSDEGTIFTCFLEYETDTVKVHDLVYRRQDGAWRFDKSFYRKLRLSPDWVEHELTRAGFGHVDLRIDRGLATIVARKTG